MLQANSLTRVSRSAKTGSTLALLTAALCLFGVALDQYVLLLLALPSSFLALSFCLHGCIACHGGRLRGAQRCAWGLLIGLVTILLCVFQLINGNLREWVARNDAFSDLQNIKSAISAYEDAHASIPPAAIYDQEGRPLLSWRVIILPYIGEKGLYKEFHLDEPWDSPHNLALLDRMPKVYASKRSNLGPPDSTPYEAFVGKTGSQDLSGYAAGKHTLLLTESAEGLPWTKPQDVECAPGEELPPLGGVYRSPFCLPNLLGRDHRGFHVVTREGMVYWIPANKSVKWTPAVLADELKYGNLGGM